MKKHLTIILQHKFAVSDEESLVAFTQGSHCSYFFFVVSYWIFSLQKPEMPDGQDIRKQIHYSETLYIINTSLLPRI